LGGVLAGFFWLGLCGSWLCLAVPELFAVINLYSPIFSANGGSEVQIISKEINEMVSVAYRVSQLLNPKNPVPIFKERLN
jgi:hypothetical protein